jgi:hypothetical protein
VTAAAFPLAGHDPLFVEEEPFNRPRDDPIDDVFIGPPPVLNGIVNAQTRERGWVPPPVYMLWRLASPTRVRSDRRVDNKDVDILVDEVPAVKMAAREISDPDAICLAYRLQRAFPHPDPTRVRNKAKLRALCSQSSILLLDRQWTHRGLITPGAASRRRPRLRRHSC